MFVCVYIYICHSREAALGRRVGGTAIRQAAAPASARIQILALTSFVLLVKNTLSTRVCE